MSSRSAPGLNENSWSLSMSAARSLIVLVHVEVTLAPPHESKDAALVLPRGTEND
jgi:hypothetical protein